MPINPRALSDNPLTGTTSHSMNHRESPPLSAGARRALRSLSLLLVPALAPATAPAMPRPRHAFGQGVGEHGGESLPYLAMAGAPPPLSSPWLTRADEVSPHDPRVAYYLRMHAAEEGLRSGAAPAALATLLARLEKDKPRAGLESRAADAAHCAAFADKVFARADAKACARCACRWCLKDASGHRTLIERRCAVLMWS